MFDEFGSFWLVSGFSCVIPPVSSQELERHRTTSYVYVQFIDFLGGSKLDFHKSSST